MTTTSLSAQSPHARDSRILVILAATSLLAFVLALAVGDRTAGQGMAGMPMTHYMELLAVQQPWNLLLFMALPVVLAEALAITELALLLKPQSPAWVHRLSRLVGLAVGPVWVFIITHLLVHALVPLTALGAWRGSADVIAVVFYLLGGLPMIGITLLEARLVGADPARWQRLHVTMVAIFLVVAHVAMIFGMLDPGVMGWNDQAPMTHQMPGMDHGTHTMPSDHPMPSPTPSR